MSTPTPSAAAAASRKLELAEVASWLVADKLVPAEAGVTAGRDVVYGFPRMLKTSTRFQPSMSTSW